MFKSSKYLKNQVIQIKDLVFGFNKI
jgi:hypothetical protein